MKQKIRYVDYSYKINVLVCVEPLFGELETWSYDYQNDIWQRISNYGALVFESHSVIYPKPNYIIDQIKVEFFPVSPIDMGREVIDSFFENKDIS